MAQTLVGRLKTFAKPDLKWRKPTLRGWLALSFVALVSVGVTAFFTPMVLGWKLIGGFSMEPTMSWRSYIWTENLADPARGLEIGDIVLVDNAVIGKSTKRVIEIDPERGLYVVGDNKAITSMDSSYGPSGQEVWIPFSDVRYRVKDILTLRRLWQAITKEGRFQNWLEIHEPMWAGKPAQSGYLVFELELNEHGNTVDVVKVGEHRRQRVEGGYVDLLKPNTLVYHDGISLHEFNLATGTDRTRPSTPPQLTLPWEGEAVVRTSNVLGAVLYVEGVFPREASVLVYGKPREVTMMMVQDWDPVLERPVTMVVINPREDLTEAAERDNISSIRIRVES